jgi:hypothetical protein
MGGENSWDNDRCTFNVIFLYGKPPQAACTLRL